MDIKDDFGLKRPKERFSLNEKTDVPLYKKPGSYNNYKELVGVQLKDILHSDQIIMNKSDYTQRGDE